MNLQGLIVMAIAALAACFLAWRIVGPFVRGPASSGCHGCATPCELKTVAKREPCAKPPAAAAPRAANRTYSGADLR
jgi:hypothetical protein